MKYFQIIAGALLSMQRSRGSDLETASTQSLSISIKKTTIQGYSRKIHVTVGFIFIYF